MTVITKIKWGNANFKWNNSEGDTNYTAYTGHTPYTWNEVFLIDEVVEEIIKHGGYDPSILDHWEEDKKKRLITLICKVQGKKIIQTKEIQDFKITVKDIKLAYKAIKGVELTTENISF